MGRGEVPTLRIDRSLTRSIDLYNEDPLRWMEEAARMGPIVALRFGPVTPTYVLNDAEAARAIFIADANSWKRPFATICPIRLATGENLFTQSDRDWSQLQPALAPHFRKRALQRRLDEAAALVVDEVSLFPHDVDIDFDQATGRLALIFAAWVLFTEHLDRGRADELVSHQRAIVEWLAERIGSRRAGLPVAPGRDGRHMRAHRAAARCFATEIIAARRCSAPKGDVLDALLAARPRGRRISPDELSTQVLGLLFAGNETTAAALSWAAAYGAANPAAWAKLRDAAASPSHYAAETLRLSPPAWGIPRGPAGPRGAALSAGGRRVHVRPYQMVAVNVYGMNRDESVWPRAGTFDPERHRSLSRQQERSLIPFGLGLRGCIGQQIALAELDAALAVLARHGDVEIEGPPVGHPTFTLKVRGGLQGRFRQARTDPARAQEKGPGAVVK